MGPRADVKGKITASQDGLQEFDQRRDKEKEFYITHSISASTPNKEEIKLSIILLRTHSLARPYAALIGC